MEGSDHCRRDEVSDWVKLVNVSGDGLMVMTAIDDGGNESLCAAAATVRQEPSKFESVRPRRRVTGLYAYSLYLQNTAECSQPSRVPANACNCEPPCPSARRLNMYQYMWVLAAI